MHLFRTEIGKVFVLRMGPGHPKQLHDAAIVQELLDRQISWTLHQNMHLVRNHVALVRLRNPSKKKVVVYD